MEKGEIQAGVQDEGRRYWEKIEKIEGGGRLCVGKLETLGTCMEEL